MLEPFPQTGSPHIGVIVVRDMHLAAGGKKHQRSFIAGFLDRHVVVHDVNGTFVSCGAVCSKTTRSPGENFRILICCSFLARVVDEDVCDLHNTLYD